jgi:hypothetical protein
MPVTDKRYLMRELRQFCYSYRDEYSRVKTVVDQYYMLADVYLHAKKQFVSSGRPKKIYASDVVYEISKVFGVSSQTVYRARAAVQASRNGSTPKKYAIRSYRNIKNQLKSW